MTDGDALLKTILANPADDTARLVYADWLQEQGREERAEFIRVQVELARHTKILNGVECHDCDVSDLRRRERELLDRIVGPNGARQWSQWVAVELGLLFPGNCGNIFTRGFIESIRCPWEFWRDRSDVILKRHPIEKVTLTTQAYTDSGFPLAPDMLSTANGWEKIVFEYSEYIPMTEVDNQYNFVVRDRRRNFVLRRDA